MSGNRKLYKTKLCLLYQKGQCDRPSCNFAHGNADLRRSSLGGGGGSSFNGRRDYRSGDLRDKLGRRYSPSRRYSPVRDARSRHAFHAQKPLSRDRGNSRSMSPARRSERAYRRKHHADGESDGSKSFNISDGYEDPKKDYTAATHDKNYLLEEQLKQTHSEIEILEDDKAQLQNILQEKIEEEHKLSSRIKDLGIQLDKEQEDCKRITSKIKKFVRAHRHYLKTQEELKRSQARLQQLGDLLGSDISETGAGEEFSNVNVPSDEEPNGDNKINPRNDEIKFDALSVKKRPHVLPASSEEAKAANSQKRGRYLGLISRPEKIIRSEGPARQSEYDNKETESEKTIPNKKEVTNSLSDDYMHKHAKNNNGSMTTAKVKGFDNGRAVPSTSIAAHAVDELIETEMEDISEDMEVAAVYENGVVDNKASTFYLPPPPPPPIDLNAYKQYEGDDRDVDVEKVDNEMLDIDLNDEVEIE